MRRRKWLDKQTGKSNSTNWDLTANGTSCTKGVAVFFKSFLDKFPISSNGSIQKVDVQYLSFFLKSHQRKNKTCNSVVVFVLSDGSPFSA